MDDDNGAHADAAICDVIGGQASVLNRPSERRTDGVFVVCGAFAGQLGIVEGAFLLYLCLRSGGDIEPLGKPLPHKGIVASSVKTPRNSGHLRNVPRVQELENVHENTLWKRVEIRLHWFTHLREQHTLQIDSKKQTRTHKHCKQKQHKRQSVTHSKKQQKNFSSRKLMSWLRRSD